MSYFKKVIKLKKLPRNFCLLISSCHALEFSFVQVAEKCWAEQSLTWEERDHEREQTLRNTRFYSNGVMVRYETVTQHQAAGQQWGSTKECLKFAQQGYLPRLRMLRAQGGLSGATGSRRSFNTGPKSTQQIQILWKWTARSRQEGILERCFQHWVTDLRWVRAGHTNTTFLSPLLR